MASNLHERLRGIVHGARSAVPSVSTDGTAPSLDPAQDPSGLSTRIRSAVRIGPDHMHAAANCLGGAVIDRPDGAVVVVDREYQADALHGCVSIGQIVDTIREGADGCATLGRAFPAAAGLRGADPEGSASLLFLDLETTGLAGGAGTHAFLVGCAYLDGSAIRIRQFLLPGFEHEPAVLAEVGAFAQDHGALVTFNGRSFDVPLIETRYLFHRQRWPLNDVPHLDMLHAARRLWRTRPTLAVADPDAGSCSLSVIERYVAGLHRVGDVPGFEIPSRYFQFVRDGDARPLVAVLEHNRLDLVSLAAVMARAITLVERGPMMASNAHEVLGLARLYERAGAEAEAEGALRQVMALARRTDVEPDVHGDALRRLAWIQRRGGRPHEAAEAWQQLATLPRCPGALRREAREALAIHHEHRSRDLGTARSLVLEVLREDAAGHRREAAEHRLRRLEKKIAVREQGGLMAALDDGATR